MLKKLSLVVEVPQLVSHRLTYCTEQRLCRGTWLMSLEVVMAVQISSVSYAAILNQILMNLGLQSANPVYKVQLGRD